MNMQKDTDRLPNGVFCHESFYAKGDPAFSIAHYSTIVPYLFEHRSA